VLATEAAAAAAAEAAAAAAAMAEISRMIVVPQWAFAGWTNEVVVRVLKVVRVVMNR